MKFTNPTNLNTDLVWFVMRALCRDWRAVIMRLVQQGFTRKESIALIFKYVCFLSLTYTCSDRLIPSAKVDLVHHALLEKPAQYQQTMQRLGHWVDHEIYNEENNLKREQRFLKSQQLFLETFGFPLMGQTETNLCSGGCYLQRASCAENPLIQVALKQIELKV